LKFDPDNPREHNPRNIGMIADSLQEVGPGRSILIDENNVIIAGNGTVEAAAQVGITKVRIVDIPDDEILARRWTTKTDAQKRRGSLYDNRTTDLSDWNREQMEALREESMLERLFTDEEMAHLFRDPTQIQVDPGSGGDDFEEEPDERQTRVRPGDIWQVGVHSVACMDSTNPATLPRLVGRERGGVVGIFTSPPYAEQRASHYESIPEEEYLDWWMPVQVAAHQILQDDGSFFINIKAHAQGGERSLYVMDLIAAMKRRWGWHFVDELCWLRRSARGSGPTD